MKKLVILSLVFFLTGSAFIYYGVEEEVRAQGEVQEQEDEAQLTADEILALEKEACFNFFWENTNFDNGLTLDRYPSNNQMASIASSGFALTAIPIGIQNNYITYQEGYDNTVKMLNGLLALDHVNGFFYHFYDINTGEPLPGVEVSNIDTSILLCGAITVKEYFNDPTIDQLVDQLYDRVNWQWFYDTSVNQFYMAYYPSTGQFSGHWDYYAEQLMIYVLAAGSDTYPVGIEAYNGFTKSVGSYGGYEFIHSWFGSLFTYQYSHAWIDFRNIEDANGINWFENSVNASYASWQYAVDLDEEFVTYNQYAWGFTACDGPNGYNGKYGSPPSGNNNSEHYVDGTVPPSGAIGSIVFVPELVLPTVEYYYNQIPELWGTYGFKDAYNQDLNWVATDVIGIDKGITMVMIENYQTELIWDTFMKNENVQQGLVALGFTVVS